MEWYLREKRDDFIVPNNLHEETCSEDVLPAQDDLCRLGVIQSKDTRSKNGDHVTLDVTSVNRQNLFDQVCHVSLKAERKVSSTTCTCGHPYLTDCSARYFQLDVELENSMEKMDNIFFNSFIEDDQMFPASGYKPLSFEDPLANTGSDLQNWLDSSRCETSASIDSCSFPMFMDHELEDGSKVEDGSPCPTPEVSKRSEGSPTNDVPSATNKIDKVSDIDEHSCLEATVLLELEDMMLQMTEKTRIFFRDALYRLAKSSEQCHITYQNRSGICTDKPATRQTVGEGSRNGISKCTESNADVIDRTVANLMKSKACNDPSELLFA